MFKDFCIACGLENNSNKTFLPLFHWTFDGKEFTKQGKMFADCIFNVTTERGYPEFICSHCHTKLFEFNEFRQIALHTHEEISEKIKDLISKNVKPLDLNKLKAEDGGVCHEINEFSGKYLNIPESKVKIELNDREENVEIRTYEIPVDRIAEHINLNKNQKSVKKLNKGNYHCDICSTVISSKRALLVHKNKHTCRLCHTTFVETSELKDHMITHETPQESCVCRICGKVFKRLHLLTVHEKRHTRPRVIPCHLCEKKFKFVGDLGKHLKIHKDGLKKFVCDICGYAFRGKPQLALHIETHSTVKLYKCHLCFIDLKTKYSLNCHLQRKHYKAGKYICLFCKSSYGSNSHLIRHIKTHVKSGAIQEEEIKQYAKLDFTRQRN